MVPVAATPEPGTRTVTAQLFAILAALAPVFFLVALGFGLRRARFADESFWRTAERLVYWVLFPPLLFQATAGADLRGLAPLALALALVTAIVMVVALVLAGRQLLGVDDQGLGSVVQGAIRPNTYVALAAVSALYGDVGLARVGIVVFVVITTVNVVSVLTLVRLGQGAHPTRMLSALVTNPLIIACAAGFVSGALALQPPLALATAIDVIGGASLPLGLLCVGAGLDLGRLGDRRIALGITCALKLALVPAAIFLFCWLFGVDSLTTEVAVLYNAVPISASSYVLARQLGSDAPLMAELITISTLAAVVTMPLALLLLA